MSAGGESLRTTTKAGFGVGQIAGQLFRDAPSLLLLFYLTSVLGIEPALAGASIFVPKVLFGAVFDLGIGITSDRIAGWFPRSRWLLIGALAAPVAMIAPFAVPDTAVAYQMAWVFVAFSFYMAVFSTFSVPYLAQFAELTDAPAERTELMAWKHGFTGIGVLLGSAGTPVLIHLLGGGRSAYLWSVLATGLACLVCLLTAWSHARNIPVRKATARALRLAELPRVFTDRNFVVLCLSAVIMTVAAGTSYASFAFFMRFVSGRSDAFVQIGIISTIMAVAVVIGSPTWVYVARKIGKKRTYLLAASGHGFTAIAWGLMAHESIGYAYLFAALTGLFNSGWGLIVLSMLSDVIAHARVELGEDRAGAYSAVWSIIEKAGIAFGGTLVVGSILSFAGFDAAAASHGLAQTPRAMAGITLAYAYVPGVAKLAAALMIWRWVPDDIIARELSPRVGHA